MIACRPAGSVEFKVFLPHAARVELVADFTQWRSRAVPMSRLNPGWWTAEVDVSPGDHEFCYLVDGSIWLADYAAHGVHADRSGRWMSSLHVDGGAAEPAAAS